MVKEKMLWLSLPQHLDMPYGLDVGHNRDEDAEKLWEEHCSKAQEMTPGSHDLTPPSLRDLGVGAGLMMRDGSHGVHRILHSRGARFSRDTTFKYKNPSDDLALIMFPDHTKRQNVVFEVYGAPKRLYYMLRLVQVSPVGLELPARELVGVGVGVSEETYEPAGSSRDPFRFPGTRLTRF